MSDIQEVKQMTESLQTAFKQFKDANDQRLDEISKKGSADVVLAEKVDRINSALDKLQDEVKAVKTAATRVNVGGQSDDKASWKKALAEYAVKSNEQHLDKFMAQKSLTVINDADGGFLVIPELSREIVTRAFETTPMRQVANIMQTSSEAIEMLRDTDEAGAEWVGETASRPETTTPQLAMIRIATHEIHAAPHASQKLLDDAYLNAEEWLLGKLNDRFTRRENAAFVNGNGVAQPRGFLSYTTAATADSARAWGVLEHVNTGANGNFLINSTNNGAETLIDLQFRLKAEYRPNASFMMPKATLGAVRKLRDAQLQYLWQPSVQLGVPSTLLGAPVIEAEDMPAFNTTGALGIAYGDFRRGYTIVDRMGVRILRDPYTAAPFVKFRATKRVGGDVTNFECIKLLRFSA